MKASLDDFVGSAETLVAALSAHAAAHPSRTAFSFLTFEGRDVTLTYGELDRRARAIAARIQREADVTKPALLLYPPGSDFVVALFACLYAGVVAVPAAAPDASRLKRVVPRLRAIAASAGCGSVLVTRGVREMAMDALASSGELARTPWLETCGVDQDEARGFEPPRISPDRLAILQYTSGSTGAPKGVMLTHRNLVHNVEQIRRLFESDAHSRGVIWLPPHHDMGLIGGIFAPIYAGYPVTLMSPVAFLKRPHRWLQTISEARGTISGGPDFAYDWCVRRVTDEQKKGLDLRSWRVAFSGSEPVRQSTLERFAEAFAQCGFRPEAFVPCYGLAEATLLVTSARVGRLPSTRCLAADALDRGVSSIATEGTTHARTLVGVGGVGPDQRVVVVDPATRVPCGPGVVGEIWVSGPSVALGYWGLPELSELTFGATLDGLGDAKFLRTGDLGFMEDDELYVTGRLKDLIIIRGRNLYPHDIEASIQALHDAWPALQPHGTAAFSIDSEDGEQLVILQEVSRRGAGDGSVDVHPLEEAIRTVVTDNHSVAVHEVLFVRPGAIPKTSSGKTRRALCRQAFMRRDEGGMLSALEAAHA